MFKITKLNKMFILITVFLIIGFTFAGIGCVDKNTKENSTTKGAANTSESSAAKQSIIVKGSDTILPLSQAEAEEYMAKNQNSDITVIGGGSGVGIAALIDGEADIAMASREMKDSEIENAKNNGINPVETVIGWDGIAVVVNPENPVAQITFSQLQAIYDGNISNWKDVGGEDVPITIISRDSSSGTYEYFKEEVLKGREYRQDALVEPATGAIVQEVAQNKGAIGYIGYAYLDKSTKALALDGGEGKFVPATEENILGGEYPLARQLYYYTNGEPQGLAKEFKDYVMSEEGQAIVSDVGYFPVK
ncbi:PstS family phosphate ABC transporter substrate-binding protein [uncultured Methanomethylovorans sp.]|uniref:PstS family phosphate ABC transporter substrate-binding protein n=1 Tax=uncultured Methanomethylovorans sp. TaxID=183759 RepID=UPI002AA8082D|nr:PstS family phosphate ABC transporter substrate-binding protein [uncultured Methanomethylovorans sp.]